LSGKPVAHTEKIMRFAQRLIWRIGLVMRKDLMTDLRSKLRIFEVRSGFRQFAGSEGRSIGHSRSPRQLCQQNGGSDLQ
jgi:hypothetical protein